MTKFMEFRNGPYRYAVNASSVAFVCVSANDGRTRIFFSSREDDHLTVDDDFETAVGRLAQ